MARRTGLPSLRTVAREMCRLLTKFDPVIRALYGDNTTLIAALEAANAACAVLVAEIDEAVPSGV